MRRRDFFKSILAAAVPSTFLDQSCSAKDPGSASREAALNVKRRLEAALLALSGVSGVGFGLREEKGVLFQEEAIRVYVRDLAQVPVDLPKEISGIPVCVVRGNFRCCTFPPDIARYDTLIGGIRIVNPSTSTINLSLGYGTLGAIVKDVTTGELLGLSCFHVVGVPQVFPDIVWQPDHPPLVQGSTISSADSIGAVLRVDFPKTITPELQPRVIGTTDSAVFSLQKAIVEQGRQTSPAILHDVAPALLVNSITGTSPIRLTQPVKKRGFMTRVTSGLVIDPNLTYPWKPRANGLPLPEYVFNQSGTHHEH
ncbi:MAG: hypothetical protein M3178_12320 [Pseudomonadota bacterium]|nr:hypothetical protein [Pseudomonadota bacterium]